MNDIDENAIATLQDVVTAYDGLEIEDKRRELGIELTELTVVVKKLLNDVSEEGPMLDVNSLEEYKNLYSGAISEGEYLTGMYEDILILKELLGIYFGKIAPAIYDVEE